MPSYRDYNKLTCKIIITGKDSGETIELREVHEVKVEKSYDTITDTCEITLPRDNRWITKDSSGFNEVKAVGTYKDQLKGRQADEDKVIMQAGDSVEVWLGYDFNDKLVFEGFITGITPQSPFVLKCEDTAWLLKRNKINYSSKGKVKLSEIAHRILQDTEVELHPITQAEDIEFGKLYIMNLTAAQFLNDLKNDYGLISFIKEKKLVIGRTFFASGANTFKTAESPDYEPPVINLHYDVPRGGDGLELNSISSQYLAIEAISVLSNNGRIKLTVALHPRDSSKLVILDEDQPQWTANQREQRKKEIEREVSALGLNIINYQTRTLHNYNITRDQLLKSAQSFYSKYVGTGMEGHLTLFGDFNFEPATTVILLDRVNPEKNGEFIIQDVNISFGQGGLRYHIHIPQKIRNIEKAAKEEEMVVELETLPTEVPAEEIQPIPLRPAPVQQPPQGDILINLTRFAGFGLSPWNNISADPRQTGNIGQNLKDINNEQTTVGLAITVPSPEDFYSTPGSTGNNSGAFGDFASDEVQSRAFQNLTLELNGLKSNQVYSLEFFASQHAYHSDDATYTVQGTEGVYRGLANNKTATYTATETASPTGKMTIEVGPASGTVGTIAAFRLSEIQ